MAAIPDSKEKRSNFYNGGKCHNDCEVMLVFGQDKPRLYVCMDNIAKLSEHFRKMFFGKDRKDWKEKVIKEVKILDEVAEDIIVLLNTYETDDQNKIIGKN